jgi:hypothetical protein
LKFYIQQLPFAPQYPTRINCPGPYHRTTNPQPSVTAARPATHLSDHQTLAWRRLDETVSGKVLSHTTREGFRGGWTRASSIKSASRFSTRGHFRGGSAAPGPTNASIPVQKSFSPVFPVGNVITGFRTSEAEHTSMVEISRQISDQDTPTHPRGSDQMLSMAKPCPQSRGSPRIGLLPFALI